MITSGKSGVGTQFDRLVGAIDAAWKAPDRIERDHLPQAARVEIGTISLRGDEADALAMAWVRALVPDSVLDRAARQMSA